MDSDSKPERRISRRDFIKLLKVAGLSALLGGYASLLEPGWLEVTEVGLRLPRLPGAFSGFRMVQVSDIHLGGWMNVERMEHVFEVAMGLAPNLVALTGDFVLGYGERLTSARDLLALEAALKRLTMHFPTFAILGNHDYWLGAATVLALLERSGVKALVNSVEKIQVGKDFIHLGGVDDVYKGMARLSKVLARLPSEGCAILLAHEPDFADDSAATGRFDLQISGHSHGGQVNLPLIGPPILPYLAQRYPSGLYRVGQMYQYTNRGVGMTPPFIRLNCRPEITVFTLLSV